MSATRQIHHRGAMIHPPSQVLQELARPSNDGYRTPTIEDPEHPAHASQHRKRPLNTASYFFDGLQHGAGLSRPSTPATEKAKHRVLDGLSDDSGYHLDQKPMALSWRKRMKHVTWAYFTITMATGGIANVLSRVPFRFRGLETIGCIIFLFNIALYICIWAMILTRFYLYPYTFRASFTHPTESLFVPAVAVSFGTILINIVEYGFGKTGLWLNRAVLVLFWFDATLAVFLSVLIYMILWSTQTFTIARMTPIWIFPAYPLLIIGTHAGNLSARIENSNHALTVIIGGFTIQGIGFLVSLTMYSALVYRLMTQKLPPEPLRPGMFVSVGPAGFTASGLISMAANLHKAIVPTSTYMGASGYLAATILRIVANWVSLWIWGLALWFFLVSCSSHWTVIFIKSHKMPFAMTWFSFVFPQTALTTATLAVGEAFDVYAIQVLGCVMTCLLLVAWCLVVFAMCRAIMRKEIMWPEQGEDRVEGGFRAKYNKPHDSNLDGMVENAEGEMASNEREDV